jgi:predicted acetyltransferase
VKLTPAIMARVVDVKQALEMWTPIEADLPPMRVAISDQNAAWNNALWQIECSGSAIAVKQVSDGAPHVSLDIRAFSQAYFGSPTLQELRAAGRLTVHDEEGFNSLCRLLNGPPAWFNDTF